MQSNYTFLTDHSYSIRVDYDKMKSKKSRGSSNRSNKPKTNNRTVSIDRSSSDKENNSSNPTMNTSGNKAKKKTTASRQSTNSRTPSGKKQNNKTTSKTNIIKKKNTNPIDINDASPSLSIEERVKLRRTKLFQTPIKPVSIKKDVKRIHPPKSNKKVIKKESKKFFLGSGLDLDNIVLGNRRQRSS